MIAYINAIPKLKAQNKKSLKSFNIINNLCTVNHPLRRNTVIYPVRKVPYLHS